MASRKGSIRNERLFWCSAWTGRGSVRERLRPSWNGIESMLAIAAAFGMRIVLRVV